MKKAWDRTATVFARGGGLVAMAMAWAGAAAAQTAVAQPDSPPAEQAGAGESGDEEEIVVTGSRIQRTGFDQPTPTTVIGDVELRQGARPNLAQVLNDSPQFRPTTTPQVSNGNTSSGSAPVDLRGLGAARTLTLINGRRFVGNNNLNYVPINLVERVEVVTGGASAAYGSDAVAGVVNIILKDELEGFSVGALSGISSRGDGMRYGGDLSFGASFAGDKGRFLSGVEYVEDKGIPDRNSRRNLGSSAIVALNPTDPTDNRQILVRDVNNGSIASAGLITSGIFAGQIFNENGTLRPFRTGTSLAANPARTPFPTQVIGGEDAEGQNDAISVSTPLQRISAFARASYDLGGVTAFIEGSYGRSKSAPRPFLPNIGLPTSILISANNAFLSPAVRGALAAAGQSSFTLGKFFDGDFELGYNGTREQKEGAIGVDGELGGFRFSAHYSHGEVLSKQRIRSPLIANYDNARNAVSSGGQIVCAINADAIATNDDPACRPLNLFGENNGSPEAQAYVFGLQRNNTTTKLDSVAAEIQGDLFSLWAGPVTVALGAEARFEEQVSISGALDLAGAYGTGVGLYRAPVNGGFNVKEGFAEVALPLLNIDGTVKVDLNGAARYSDYSRSGGIWSWKAGGTVGLFDALLLRATRSRDIRAPSIVDLFQVQGINIGSLVDQDNPAARRAANPLYNPAPTSIRTLTGGNPNLVPEIGKTVTFGATFSPNFLRDFNLSVDYYDIEISDAIFQLTASQLTLACRNGNEDACARIARDANGTVTEVRSNAANIASFTTKGIDFEASYLLRLSRLSETLPGSLRVRALASYVKDFIFNSGAVVVDTAGDVGTGTANAIPKWRGVLSFTYQSNAVGLDARLRYVDGGKFNHLLDGVALPQLLVNNDIGSRTYFDLGTQFKAGDRITVFGNVNNLFDVAPPISTTSNIFYDVVGTYFTAGARVNF